VLAGALLIVLSGLFILWRERRRPSTTKPNPNEPLSDESEQS